MSDLTVSSYLFLCVCVPAAAVALPWMIWACLERYALAKKERRR